MLTITLISIGIILIVLLAILIGNKVADLFDFKDLKTVTAYERAVKTQKDLEKRRIAQAELKKKTLYATDEIFQSEGKADLRAETTVRVRKDWSEREPVKTIEIRKQDDGNTVTNLAIGMAAIALMDSSDNTSNSNYDSHSHDSGCDTHFDSSSSYSDCSSSSSDSD